MGSTSCFDVTASKAMLAIGLSHSFGKPCKKWFGVFVRSIPRGFLR